MPLINGISHISHYLNVVVYLQPVAGVRLIVASLHGKLHYNKHGEDHQDRFRYRDKTGLLRACAYG